MEPEDVLPWAGKADLPVAEQKEGKEKGSVRGGIKQGFERAKSKRGSVSKSSASKFAPNFDAVKGLSVGRGGWLGKRVKNEEKCIEKDVVNE